MRHHAIARSSCHGCGLGAEPSHAFFFPFRHELCAGLPAAWLAARVAGTAGAPSAIDVKPQPSAVSTAHPLATHAALRVLAEGGNAIDATIAAQLVLGLVEPQSSGLGGGSMLLVWNPARQQLRSYDGLAAAPTRRMMRGPSEFSATAMRLGRSPR